MKGGAMYYSSLICNKCGLIMTIPRYKCDKRKEGHIKTMYCVKCGDTQDFTESNYKPLERGHK